jgi:hypothetical protein
MTVEMEHESPRIGKVRWDPRHQRSERPDLVFLEVVKEHRLGKFVKKIVRPLLRRIQSDVKHP